VRVLEDFQDVLIFLNICNIEDFQDVFYLNMTCNKEYTNEGCFYCMKKLTRIEGPWSEKDYKEPEILLRGVIHMKVIHMK